MLNFEGTWSYWYGRGAECQRDYYKNDKFDGGQLEFYEDVTVFYN